MKLRKLLARVEAFLGTEEGRRGDRMASMRDVLDALKRKERHLKSKAAAEKDADARAEIERKREVVHAQRKKGLKALKELKKS